MTNPVDKDSLPLNQPRRTPNHPTKSHIVKTKVDGKEKIIRFGQQGASTAGKPKEGESDRMTAKRASFKARHSANIAKGPSSAAYWANKVKWADGGSVSLDQLAARYDKGGDVDTGAAFGFNPNIQRQGARARALAQQSDVNTLPDPKTYAAISGLFGTAPDEMGFSVMHPQYEAIRGVADPAFAIGTALQVAPIAGALTKLAGKGVMAAGRAGERMAERVVPQIMDRGGFGAQLLQDLATGSRSNVVKPKGGNWRLNNIENAITDTLKNNPVPMDKFAIREAMTGDELGRYFAAADAPGVTDLESQLKAAGLYNKYATPPDAVNTWIDKKLANYIRNDMATPEDPLRAMAEKWSVDKPELLAQAEAKLAGLNAKTRELAAQRGVPEAFLTSHRQEVIAAERARDFIEAREALHTPPPAHGGGRWEPEYLAGQRKNAGFPAEGMGQSEPAKVWEQASDEAIGTNTAGSYLERPDNLITKLNPWLEKVPPETLVHNTRMTEDLGFEHLVDELRNSLDPNSGLPAELLMKYSDLPKKTMPDVVNRVADINAWRSAQKAEADLTKANNVAVVPFKEYPEQGLAWKEFKTPEAKSVDELGPEQKSMYDDYIAGGVPPERALKEVGGMGEGKNILRDALQYEGDTLQHCVGGANYCEAIKAGESKIYSLRDERGKPHATIEVRPNTYLDFNSWFGQQTPEMQNKIRASASRGKKEPRAGVSIYDAPEYLEARAAMPPVIEQIKGLRNGPPEEKYMPAIQDFIKSGNWSDVRDLKHSGMVDIQDPNAILRILQKASPERDIQKAVDNFNSYIEANPQSSRYATPDEIGKWLNPPTKGFAEGGLVGDAVMAYDPLQIDAVMASMDAPRNYAEGGDVDLPDMEFSDDPEALRLYNHVMGQKKADRSDSFSNVGGGLRSGVAGGSLSAGLNMSNMTQNERDQLMNALVANYNIDIGDLNLNAGIQKPLDAKDVYVGMLNGSIPLGTGRAMLGVQGVKTPYGREVQGYNAGWSGKVGPGRLSANVNMPKRGSKSANVQYQIPFAEGGSVSAYDQNRVDAIANQFM